MKFKTSIHKSLASAKDFIEDFILSLFKHDCEDHSYIRAGYQTTTHEYECSKCGKKWTEGNY